MKQLKAASQSKDASKLKAAIRQIKRRPHNPQGEEAVKLLRNYYQLGTELRRFFPSNDRHMGYMVEFTRKFGVSRHTAYKAMAFATQFSDADLEELCNKRDSNGNPLSWAQVIQLLSLKRKDRQRLLKLTVKNGWSSRQLIAEIKSMYGRESGTHGGRPFRHQRSDASNTAEAVVQFLERMQSMRRSLDVAVSKGGTPHTAGVLSRLAKEGDCIPESQLELLDENLRAIARLVRQARTSLSPLLKADTNLKANTKK